VIVEDVARLEQFRGTIELEIVLEDDIRSIQSTPLISRDGRLLGMLNNHYRAPGRPDDASLRHIDLLARQAADLIERHQAEEALRKANRHKDEFLAMLSHELRNPLAALTSAARLLELVPPASEQAAKARGVIERQTRHMSRLVGDLLDISRVAMGKLVLQRERFDAAEAISSVVHAWRTSGRLDGHEVSLAAESVWVEGDRARIEQIASNLLDNALKFTPPGKSVTVDLRREDGGAVLRVADQGRGLAAEDCSRIFDLFTQGDTPDRTGGGLGIGLALVKRLAERHGGTVSATSDGPGHGAIFTVRLPAVEPPPLLVPRAAPAAGDARATAGLP
jgi:signal transduction histidine kinase